MRRNRVNALASTALGLGIATSAVLGPLVLGIIRVHESANMESQLLGGELTSLFLAAPLACIAGILWWRAPRLAPVIGIGPAGYALYTYVQFVLVPDYTRYPGNNERFFPLYLALVMLGGGLVWRSWHELSSAPVATPPRRLATMSGTFLIVAHGALALAWIGSIATTLFGQPSPEYQEHPTGFWLVRLMDLGFVIPFGLTAGIGLLRGAPWASRNAYAIAGSEALLACAVSGMAIRMWMQNDPAATPTLPIVSTLGAIAFLTMYVAFIRTEHKRSSPPRRLASGRRGTSLPGRFDDHGIGTLGARSDLGVPYASTEQTRVDE